MIVIGESINIMSAKIGAAIKEFSPGPVQEIAVAQVEAGADVLDLNLGPARKEGEKIMSWLVKTVQEVVDVPLALDTSNHEAIEGGLKVYQNKKGKAIVNSISARQDRIDLLMPIVKKYDAQFVGLCLTESGIPRDATERVNAAYTLITSAEAQGIATGDIYIDPIVMPVSVSQDQCVEVAEFMKMVKDLADPPPKTTCGLSNVSNGSPDELRSLINRVYLVILVTLGLDSAIVNALDKEMIDTVKTIGILQNKTIYSHSYLEL